MVEKRTKLADLNKQIPEEMRNILMWTVRKEILDCVMDSNLDKIRHEIWEEAFQVTKKQIRGLTTSCFAEEVILICFNATQTMKYDEEGKLKPYCKIKDKEWEKSEVSEYIYDLFYKYAHQVEEKTLNFEVAITDCVIEIYKYLIEDEKEDKYN